jgi:hypothetical protein
MAHTTTVSQRQARGVIGIDLIDRLTGGGLGTFDVPCALCGPLKRTLAKQRKRVLKVRPRDENFASFNCARCAEHGSIFDPRSKPPGPVADWLNAGVDVHGPALLFSAEEKLQELQRRTPRVKNGRPKLTLGRP